LQPAARAAAPPAPVEAPPAAAPAHAAAPSGNEAEERFTVAAPPAEVWAMLSDLRRTAACLPGAEITTVEGDQVTGLMRVALGPIRVSFAGQGVFGLDAARMAGLLDGGGRDQGTGSSASGTVRWRVLPHAAGSEVVVSLSWRLVGALAQFNRGGLTADLVRRLVGQFAANLGAQLAGKPPPPTAQPIGLFGLLWAALKARLFGR
jgi:carbon-monoxide dehydrogenase small subunit